MRLKPALFALKEAIVNQKVGPSEQEFIQKLETKYGLSAGTLVFYFNNFMMMNMNRLGADHQDHSDSKKVNRKWTKVEIELMFQYINERQMEGALNITEILEEVAQLLDRGYQSVNYKYYSLLKANDKKYTAVLAPNGYRFTTIAEDEVPVIATEIIENDPEAPQINQDSIAQDDDLLDILSGLITNVQKLPGINLNELLRSLFQLTNMALQNQDAEQQIAKMKSETDFEKEALKEKYRKKEQQLLQEKKRNDDLQVEVAKLAKEITAFNQLGDAAKIQHLKSYNQRLNYIIDSFGLVLKVSG